MSRTLPSEKTALSLLEVAGCSKNVIEHCKAVAAFAVKIAEGCKRKGLEVDISLVRIGALLHDIGRAKTHDVDHAIVGAQVAEDYGLSPSIQLIIERHVGGGIAKEEARKLGFPEKSYVPVSLEERLVAYADKMVDGSTIVSIEVVIERFLLHSHIPNSSIERLMHWHREFYLCLE